MDRKSLNRIKPANIKSAGRNLPEGNQLKKIKDILSQKPSAKNSSIRHKLFPIVAIGASAGGLEAYSTFLKNLPPDTGMAFVIIQHLSPDYKSMLTDILKRETKMEVLTIKNEMKPSPNTVYVVPPKSSINIENGLFHLNPRGHSRQTFMPIDIFMRSLAEDKMHYPIGVIMSGSDSDGVLGLENIKSNGGITFAQDSKTAKFIAMPRSAVNYGVVDFVLPPDAIARELKRISNNMYFDAAKSKSTDEMLAHSNEEIAKALNILKTSKNIDFNQYKFATIKRRILRRMLIHQIKNISDYTNFLVGNPEEIDSLCEDILINVTSFFRDPEMYETLKKKVFPKLMEERFANELIRIWVTACSSGEEAYSMAISLLEYLGDKASTYQIQIFSTDLSESGIEKARSGVYPPDIKNDVSEDRLRKFFIKADGMYQIKKNIRDLCVFARQNLISDPPFSKIDIISCRNVLIYLGQVLQNKILPIFHYALKPNGFLIVGTAETVGNFRHMFELVDRKNRIYSKISLSSNSGYDFNVHELFPEKMNFDPLPQPAESAKTFELQKEAEIIILKKYTPAGVIINKDMNIIHFKGNTEPYLEIQEGVPNYNLLKMARKGLAASLRPVIEEAFKKNKSIRKNNLRYYYHTSPRNVNIFIEPFLIGSAKQNNFLILFEETDKKNIHKSEIHDNNQSEKDDLTERELAQISRELELNKEHLQSVIEKHETINEELRSANEEIQSSNEELQSTNEELETTKEELQATNEELSTVNEELQNRNAELNNLNSDLNNLLVSIKMSIIMVDNSLRIKRFTHDASKLFNLIPADVGRKITDINSNMEIKNLKGIISNVIDTPVVRELEIKDKNDCWYFMRIRPYKTMENKINGAVITFSDITEMKKSMKQQDIIRREVEKLNKELEKRVEQRTSQLGKINKSLELEVVERKNIESTLRVLSINLIDAQENERLKISRELHDGVNQILSAAKLKVHSAESDLKKVTGNKNQLNLINDAKNYIVKAIEEVRRLSHALRPTSLDDIGIIAAIKSLIEDFKQRTSININFNSSPIKKRFSPEIELTIYRIVQEGLHNVEKHSKATNVKITLSHQKSLLKLSIADNGKGFKILNHSPKDKSEHKLGLVGLKERAESVGGKLYLKSEKGLGTRIDVTIPSLHKKFASEKPKLMKGKK